MPLEVVDSVFESRDGQDDEEGNGCREPRERRDEGDQLSRCKGFWSGNRESTQQGTDLQDEKTEEVKVGQTLKLFEQVLRNEGQDVVFGGLDVVVLLLRNERTRVTTWR